MLTLLTSPSIEMMRAWQLEPLANSLHAVKISQIWVSFSHFHCHMLYVSAGGKRGCQLTGIVVVEERVVASAVDEDVRGVDDSQAPRVGAVALNTVAGRREVRILEVCVDGERLGRIRKRLVVGRLGLEHSGEDVLGVRELVLVEVEMLRGATDEPEATSFGFNHCILWLAGDNSTLC